MSDLTSYPGATGLVAADPGEISALSGLFGTVASQAQNSRGGLLGAQGDSTWTGAAADAFRSKVGKLPGDLANVARSYGDVAHALNGYEAQVGPLQTQFRSVLDQINVLEGSLAGAQGQLSSAKANLTTATNAPGAKPTSSSVVQAHGAVQGASASVGRVEGEIAGLERRGKQILDEFNTARSQARSAVSHAASYAPQESWWSSVMHAVGNFLAGLAVGIGKSVWALVSGKAVIDFIDHPSWSTFGALLKDVAVTASLVALIAVPFAAPELLEADGALLAGEDVAEDAAGDALGDAAGDGAGEAGGDGAGESGGESGTSFGDVARGVNTWGNKVAMGATGGEAGTEAADGHWGAAALDVGFMAAPNVIDSVPKSLGDIRGLGDDVANAAHVGDSQAEAAAETIRSLQSSGESLSFYRFLRGFDVAPGLAQRVAFTDGVPEALKGVDLDDGSALKSVAASANSAYGAAASKSLYIGKPLAYGIDGLVVDPTHDAINHRYHLVPDDG
jgi:uncharacterized protein YukE